MKKKSVNKFLTGSVTAALVASAVAPAASAAENNFQDILNLSAEDQAAINGLAEAGVIKGYENGTVFKPFSNVNRGQVALMLTRVESLALDSTADTATNFTDVNGDAELTGAIEALVNGEIASGYSDNTFKPFNEISRQHMAKLLVKAFKLELNEEVDVNISDLDQATEEMKPYIQILASHGITVASEFKPNDPVSRYAFSLFLQRAIDVTQTPVEETPVVSSGIAGFILDGTTPLENATVTIGEETVVTDENGYYELLNVQPGKQEVVVKAEGYKTVKTSDITVLEDKVSSFNKDIHSSKINTASIEVNGVVVNNETNAALEGAAVTLESFDEEKNEWVTVATASTSSVGKYTITQTNADPDLELGAEYRQTVSKAGYKDFVQTITLNNEEVANTLKGIELDEIAAIDVAGSVLTAAGEKAADATVTIFDADGTVVKDSVTTNENGEYKVTDVQLINGTYNVVVDHAGSAYSYTEFAVEEGTDVTHDIKLQSGNTIAATIGTESLNDTFGKAGSDADNVDYTLELLNGNTVIDTQTVTGTTDADEKTLVFNFDRVAPGSYTLRVSGDYIVTEDYSITVDGAETFEDRAMPAGKISGTVDNGSTAIDGIVEVSLLDASGNVVNTVEADETGAYSFAGLQAGKYTVKASSVNYIDETTDSEITVEKNKLTGDVNLSLAPVVTDGNVAGNVRLSNTLAPAENATVTYYDADGEEVVSATVAADGSYSIADLDAATYTVVVRGTGLETYTTTQTIVAGDDLRKVNYTVTTGGDASLKISVVDSEGNPVDVAAEGFDITDAFVAPTSPTVGVWEEADNATDTVTFAGLSAGKYNVKIDVESELFVDKEFTATVASGEVQELEIVVDQKAAQRDVNYRVINEANANVSDAYVVIFNADGEIVEVQTTTDGTSALKLVDGSYTMAIIKDGYVVAENELNIAGKAVTVPVIQLSKLN